MWWLYFARPISNCSDYLFHIVMTMSIMFNNLNWKKENIAISKLHFSWHHNMNSVGKKTTTLSCGKDSDKIRNNEKELCCFKDYIAAAETSKRIILWMLIKARPCLILPALLQAICCIFLLHLNVGETHWLNRWCITSCDTGKPFRSYLVAIRWDGVAIRPANQSCSRRVATVAVWFSRFICIG